MTDPTTVRSRAGLELSRREQGRREGLDLRRAEQRRREALDLWRTQDGQLWLQSGAGPAPVRAVRCFPWSEPGRFISLRDTEDEEVALVSDVSELKPGARRALTLALLEAGFVLEIEGIDEVEEEIEIRTFRVRTRQGPRRFQTLRDEWPRVIPSGGLLIRDVAGDLYLLRNPGALDPKSERLLWAFLD